MGQAPTHVIFTGSYCMDHLLARSSKNVVKFQQEHFALGLNKGEDINSVEHIKGKLVYYLLVGVLFADLSNKCQ